MEIKKFLILIFCLGIVVRFLFLGLGLAKDGSDFILNYGDGLGYSLLAKNLAEGNGFSQSLEAPFIPDGMRTPLYPLILASSYIASGGFWPVIFMQVLFGAFISVLCYMCLRKLDFSEKISRASAAVLAVEPFWASQSVFLLTETLFIFLVFSAFYLILRDQEESRPLVRIFAPSILMGIATLIRPVGLYLIPIFALIFFFRSRKEFLPRFAGVAVFLVIGIGITLPWMWRNHEVFGKAALSYIDVLNLYSNYAGGTLAMHEGYSIDKARVILREELSRSGLLYTPFKSYSFRYKRTLEIITAYPVAFMKLNVFTGWQFFTHDSYYDLATRFGFYKDAHGSPVTVLDLKNSLAAIPGLLARDPFFFVFIAGRIFWMGAFFAFLAGIYISWSDLENRRRDMIVAAFVGYFFIASLTTGYAVNARLRLPILPFYLVYIFVAVYALSDMFKKFKSGIMP